MNTIEKIVKGFIMTTILTVALIKICPYVDQDNPVKQWISWVSLPAGVRSGYIR